jgi:hypothetical protein
MVAMGTQRSRHCLVNLFADRTQRPHASDYRNRGDDLSLVLGIPLCNDVGQDLVGDHIVLDVGRRGFLAGARELLAIRFVIKWGGVPVVIDLL